MQNLFTPQRWAIGEHAWVQSGALIGGFPMFQK